MALLWPVPKVLDSEVNLPNVSHTFTQNTFMSTGQRNFYFTFEMGNKYFISQPPTFPVYHALYQLKQLLPLPSQHLTLLTSVLFSLLLSKNSITIILKSLMHTFNSLVVFSCFIFLPYRLNNNPAQSIEPPPSPWLSPQNDYEKRNNCGEFCFFLLLY